ncbi:MAG: helicase C-terminal domain-containing protein [Opitutaceae bacterium]|nr:helicase C-terminal domain-containing protein [Opitutaceae bacterium]
MLRPLRGLLGWDLMIGLNESPGRPPAPPPVAPALSRRLFSDGGWLADGLSLEHRPQQETMALAVARSMANDEPLLFEAGTGTGKSLAYLLPGIIHAVSQQRQLIVSTHTISLQEQLDRNDLPLCRQVFKSRPELSEFADFRSTVLVGKANYLCTTRLATALRDKQELFATAEHAELMRIASWAETTKEGLRHELNPPVAGDVWDMVNADSAQCSRKYCDCERCFYQRAKGRLRQAHVVIVNHSLLFSFLNAAFASEEGAARGVLFPDDFVVLDEAHTVPEVATEHFGLRLTSYGVDRMLKHLYNPRTRRGLLQKIGSVASRAKVEEALEAARHFFAFLHEKWLTKQAIVRIRGVDAAEPWLEGPLLSLHEELRTLADQLDEGSIRDELLDQAARVNACRLTLRNFLSLADEDSVYWLERTGRRQMIIALRSAPIDIAPRLREELLSRNTSVVFTSATLALAGSMTPFQKRIGAEGVRHGIVASPFDCERNMRIFVAADVPLPSLQEARLAHDILADYIRFCTDRVLGGSLVLFTSYQDMRQIATELAPHYAGAGRPFLLQGENASRTELARLMREKGNAILFGTDSFWTGVDVPGDALAQVVITRLPFDVPSHPVLEARSDWIRNQGGQPFQELTLPEALIKFRQGVGRLLRHTADRGVITLLDSRLLVKSYGQLFFNSLPVPAFMRMTRENREEVFSPFPPRNR